jgi:hypothetical protein
MKKILFITLAGFVFASCNGKQSQEQATETPADSALVDADSVQVVSPEEENTAKQEVRDMTFEEAAGTYESLDENMNSEARIVLMADGTATWVMIGSLNYTSYTYTIHGNTICMKMKDYETEEECYDYDADTRTLKNEQGAVYYRQIEE